MPIRSPKTYTKTYTTRIRAVMMRFLPSSQDDAMSTVTASAPGATRTRYLRIRNRGTNGKKSTETRVCEGISLRITCVSVDGIDAKPRQNLHQNLHHVGEPGQSASEVLR